MGRTLGPFTDVSTARVDGAYEIYEGADEEGREIEILTLGISSSKDPSRRALLSDTVAWAHATRGPADAPILQADLNSEQPYVVTLRQTGYRGVERMLERMLAMGPPTGPLMVAAGAHTGQLPRVGHHTNPHGIPAVVSTPPAGSPIAPASPMTPYVTTARRSRPAWLIPLVIVLCLVVFGGGGLVVMYGMSGESGGTMAEDSPTPPPDTGQTDSAAPQESPELKQPEFIRGLDQLRLVGNFFDEDEGRVISIPGWPFAFRVPQHWECQGPSGEKGLDELTCQLPPDNSNPEAAKILIELRPCPDGCQDDQRNLLEDEWTQEPFTYADEDTGYFDHLRDSTYTISMSRFLSPQQNPDNYEADLQLVVEAIGPSVDTNQMQMILNDIYTQTQPPK